LLSPIDLIKQTLHLGSSVVYRGYWPSEYWLHGAPLLNAGETILLLAGASRLIKRPILRQNYFLIGTVAVSSVLVILGGSVTIAMLVPLIYLTIAGGIFYLLDEWLTIFPRNPIAKFLGVFLVCTLALFSALYHLQAYYVAWPHSPSTKSVYTVKQPS
jgi:hypothetical protein